MSLFFLIITTFYGEKEAIFPFRILHHCVRYDYIGTSTAGCRVQVHVYWASTCWPTGTICVMMQISTFATYFLSRKYRRLSLFTRYYWWKSIIHVTIFFSWEISWNLTLINMFSCQVLHHFAVLYITTCWGRDIVAQKIGECGWENDSWISQGNIITNVDPLFGCSSSGGANDQLCVCWICSLNALILCDRKLKSCVRGKQKLLYKWQNDDSQLNSDMAMIYLSYHVYELWLFSLL